MALFWEKGFDETTQADMMERTGLSSSSLYNTFGAKPAIFELVLERYNDRTQTGLAAMADAPSGLDALALFLDYREAIARNPAHGPGCLVATAMCELGARDSAPRLQCEQHNEILRAAISSAIDRGVSMGELVPGDTGARTALLIAASIGVSVTERCMVSPAQALLMIQGMRDLVDSWKASGNRTK